MTLIDNWKRTLTHGHSARCIYAGIAAELGMEALPFISDWVPRWTVVVILFAALATRILKQETLAEADK